jgi:hypothetical protein
MSVNPIHPQDNSVTRRAALQSALAAGGAAALVGTTDAEQSRSGPADARRSSPRRYAMKKSINLWAFPYPELDIFLEIALTQWVSGKTRHAANVRLSAGAESVHSGCCATKSGLHNGERNCAIFFSARGGMDTPRSRSETAVFDHCAKHLRTAAQWSGTVSDSRKWLCDAPGYHCARLPHSTQVRFSTQLFIAWAFATILQ